MEPKLPARATAAKGDAPPAAASPSPAHTGPGRLPCFAFRPHLNSTGTPDPVWSASSLASQLVSRTHPCEAT